MLPVKSHPWFQVEGRLPIGSSNFRLRIYQDPESKKEHIALILGAVRDCEGVPVRVHSECLTGDIFASARCDCGSQLQTALDAIIKEGVGVLVYLRQEGRGIGLIEKIRAYNLQDKGLDTVEANEALGHAADNRDFKLAAEILKELGPTSIRLITNNPKKINSIAKQGINIVDRISHDVKITERNRHYLQTKAEKLKHLISFH